MTKWKISAIIKRVGIVFLVSLIFVGTINEVSYQFRKDRIDRPPETIELIIPAGTADLIASGESVPEIPEEIEFVVGDMLLVINDDSSDHQMGPVWVPAGTSASLKMEEANKYAYNCSFKTSKYLGLNVQPGTTLNSRITAFALATPPTTMFLLVYSFLVFPLRKPNKKRTQE